MTSLLILATLLSARPTPTSSREPRLEIQLGPIPQDYAPISGRLAFSVDGRHLAASDSGTKVVIFDTRTGKRLHTLKTKKFIYTLTYSADGKWLATSECNKSGAGVARVRLFDTKRYREKEHITHPNGYVSAIHFMKDGEHLFTGGDPRWPKVWKISTGKLVTELKGHHYGNLYAVTEAPDGSQLVSGGRMGNTGEVLIWKPTEPDTPRRLPVSARVSAIDIRADGLLAIAAQVNVHLVHLTGKVQRIFKAELPLKVGNTCPQFADTAYLMNGHTEFVGNGENVAISDYEGVRIMNIESGQSGWSYPMKPTEVCHPLKIAVSDDGKQIAVSDHRIDRKDRVKIFDLP